ncbi:hypothetical protein HELRODRAFT_185008 [Helobdella robusta]|uniref:RRM domain-containing protein n=1 Tax=Helobdella robusta TaxID=6412 RepID=T1FM98_HELRO|nr:hypothetical protein HELRODRAFT_185008 [Helobdella robusta]ESO02645.1 hypothetical protein HELRODRAFT_185008 [Helobdella robusta]
MGRDSVDNGSDKEERERYRSARDRTSDGDKDHKSVDDDDLSPPYIVCLCGLPYSATPADITDFLSGCEVLGGSKGIHIAIGVNGRPNGIAFVELSAYSDVVCAKEKHKQNMGTRYIEVRRVSEQEMKRLLDKWKPRRDPVNAVVCIKGLPYNCTNDDIKEFFDGLEIETNGIMIVLDERGRVCGDGFVHFTSLKSVDLALRKHKEKIRHRYIEVYRSDLREMYPRSHSGHHPFHGGSTFGTPQFFLNTFGKLGGGGGGDFHDFRNNNMGLHEDRHQHHRMDAPYGRRDDFGPSRNRYRERDLDYRRHPYDRRSPPPYRRNRSPSPDRRHSDTYRKPAYRYREPVPPYRSKTGHSVHMRGLPYTVSKDQIINFFSPVLPVDVTIEMLSNGMRTGNANVDFATDDDVREAMMKDREKIDARYIELYNNKDRN